MKTIKLDTYAGDSFQEVAESAKVIAHAHDTTVEFEFNGITCVVNEDTNLEHLWKYYTDGHIMEWKTIGPNCQPEYNPDTASELSKRRLAQAARQQKEAEEYRKKEQAEREAAEEKIKDVVLLIHSDKREEYDAYVIKNSQDGYSRAVVDFAEVWAKLMQVEISKGRTEIKDIADECQSGLGYLGITGFQYGCVVSALSHFWVFGEELRRWHNKQYGIGGDKKGVVNPAILTLATQ